MKLQFTEADCLEAAVDEIIGEERLRAEMKKGTVLNIKLGIDPTSPNIHLGRSIAVWRLRAFQELGHTIQLIIGDFTGQIGDTSDKESERPMLEKQKVQENLSRYLEQLWMILNPEKKDQVHIHYNSEWLEPLTLSKLGYLADAFSVNQFIKRDLIARRLEEGSRISLREMLYPVMQGYDSIMVNADVELGGTDQRFNMLAGRILQEQAGKPAQSVIMNHLISGTDGRKMSSSWGNVISLLDSPEDKFGKLMSIRDELIGEYLYTLPISVRPFTPLELDERLRNDENPRDLKMELASRLVALYHGEDVANKVQDAFISQFREGQLPEDIPAFSRKALGSGGELLVIDALVNAKLAQSKAEARRLITQNGVRIDGIVVSDVAAANEFLAGTLIQVGKRRFVKVSE